MLSLTPLAGAGRQKAENSGTDRQGINWIRSTNWPTLSRIIFPSGGFRADGREDPKAIFSKTDMCRKERIMLKDKPDLAFARGGLRGVFVVVETDYAAVRQFQTSKR